MVFSQDQSDHQISDYRLIRRLGAGSFGDVYLAEDLREHNRVAIKLIRASLTGRDDLKAFLNEARSMRLHHPHILPFLDFGLSEQDLPFLVMEYVAGGTLRDRYPKGCKAPLEEVVDLTTQLASALQYAHDRHLMHRDVKPENMLCRTDGTVLLSDFGLASVAHATSSASVNQTFGGTLPYMAPEQHMGKPRPASDQYALAVVVYEWLTGIRPFQGTPLELVSQHLHALPPPLRYQTPTLPIALEQVVLKALSKQPQERYPRVEDFAIALQATYQPRVVFPPIISTPPQLPVSPETYQPTMNQSTESSQAREEFSPRPAPLAPSPPVKTSWSSSMEDPITPPPLPRITPLEAVPTTPLPFTPPPMSRPIQSREAPNRRVLLTILLALLVILSGLGIYFGFINQATTFPSTQANATTIANQATATAIAQAYASGTISMFGFDAAHTHNNPYDHTISPANASQLKPLWNFPTGKNIFSSPTVANGIVYIGSEDHKLYAFDATCRNACQPLWTFSTKNVINSSPAVANGTVYVGSKDHKLYAFDASCRTACQPLWTFSTGNGIESSPVVADDMLYVGSSDHKLYAFDATCHNSCHPLWTFPTGDQIESSPAIANGIAYVASYDHRLYAFDTSCRNACQPLWSFLTGDAIYSSPAVAGGIVYVGSFDHKFYAFDATCRKDCQPLWTFSTGSRIFSSPAIANGMVYIGSDDYKLYAFDATCRNACQPLWTFSTGSWVSPSPTIAGNTLYVGSADHKLYAFDATCRSGCQPLWDFSTGNRIFSSPTVAGGILYAGSVDHALYAFGLET